MTETAVKKATGNTGGTSSSRRRKNKKKAIAGDSTLITNVIFSVAIFLALVRIYDPTSSPPIYSTNEEHNNDVQEQGESDHSGHHHHHHHIQEQDIHSISSPIHVGLHDFVDGRDMILERKQDDEERNTTMNAKLRESIGKERIFDLIHQAGIHDDDITLSQIQQLPTWRNVEELYGSDVRIYNGDIGEKNNQWCNEYQRTIPSNKMIIGVAGLFNTGTNLLEHHFHKNIMNIRSLWQVPWGKHRMAEVRWNHTVDTKSQKSMKAINKTTVLPVVIIRDPYMWLQSMCSHPYNAKWRHDVHHCPNLIPNDDDKNKYHNLKNVFIADIKFDEHSTYYFNSLIDMWNTWYKQYLTANYPVLMIRFEDLVFQPQIVLEEIVKCVGGGGAGLGQQHNNNNNNAILREPIQFQIKSSKSHGSGTDFIKAIIKTADSKLRYKNMTNDDLIYVAENLDMDLMTIFNYDVIKVHTQKITL